MERSFTICARHQRSIPSLSHQGGEDVAVAFFTEPTVYISRKAVHTVRHRRYLLSHLLHCPNNRKTSGQKQTVQRMLLFSSQILPLNIFQTAEYLSRWSSDAYSNT